MVINTRGQIVKWAYAGVRDRINFRYLEERPLVLAWPNIKGAGIVNADCSWFVKLCFWKAGAPDPTGLNFDGYGNSVSLWERGTKISRAKLKRGDVITFGPEGSVHAVIVVMVGDDPICSSMGRPGAPELVNLSAMLPLGEPTFLRFRTLNRRLTPSRKQH